MDHEDVPESLLHPKNLALLAIKKLDLPEDRDFQVMVISSIPFAPIYVEVSVPEGEACEVTIDQDDTIDSLARKIYRAILMVLDAEHRNLSPQHRWADQHPEACQEPADPGILLHKDGPQDHWSLSAGWVPLMNRLHRDLAGLLGEYRVLRAGNKMSFLRVSLDRYHRHDDGPDVWREVNDLLQAIKEESLRTCELCGGPAGGSISPGSTRCPPHESTRKKPVLGALARPPGWVPRRDPLRCRE